MIAFSYKRRRDGGSAVDAAVGATISFDERVEYALVFPGATSPSIFERFRELGGEMVSDDVGVLSFGNFVGTADLAGVRVKVSSTKIGEGDVSRLMEEVSDLASSLVFGQRSPIVLEGASTHQPLAPIPFHQLQLLRQVMVKTEPGSRLQDGLDAIERNHTRLFAPERPVVPLHRVRRLDHRAVRSIFTRLDRLAVLPEGSPLIGNALAGRLTFGNGGKAHLPVTIAAPRRRLSTDTPENRFVRHVLEAGIGLVHRFVDDPNLHNSFRRDCRDMLRDLEASAAAPYLDEVQRVSGYLAPSQAMMKGLGYRELFSFWNALLRHVSLPTTAEETKRLLEGRDMARLYEYWVFLKVLDTTSCIVGRPPSRAPEIYRDDYGETLRATLTAFSGLEISVSYNPTFARSRGNAYSTPLRPDVVVQIGDVAHAFDAKYKLDRFDVADGDDDDGAATYKRADLYKMHTYRDAIRGLQTAFVVYPGSEFVFFERNGSKRTSADLIDEADGVGALPLRPVPFGRSDLLDRILTRLITQQDQDALCA